MVPLPIIGEPFSRIAMDMVGPLPRSRSGNKYVLVLCDYATRYPEAIPLKNTDAETVAEELLALFSRVGIPNEILTDQGSNFQSQLLKELYRLLRVDAIRTSPYHPQTDGLVERFNQTLKAMLKKTASEEGKDWDKLIPFLLFAYREVPQESTGYSHFELLYGRGVRGPLDVLKQSWELDQHRNQNIVSYILLQREKMEKMQEIVHSNLEKARRQQKSWYDQNPCERSFNPNDQVLVLLPTSASKLSAQWQGPYRIVERRGKVNYLVHMEDHRKKRRVFHVNMLRQWHPPVSTFQAQEVSDSSEEEDIPAWNDSDGGQAKQGIGLSHKQTLELGELLREFESLFTALPGHTTVAEHHVSTGDAGPIRLTPYRLPHAFRDHVKQELDEMLAHGVIEHSRSDWAFPLVPVKKKDSSLRLCVDYRKLNSLSKVDPYPMPRVDDLIDRVGQSPFITTLDLTKGYWQVPVAEADREKTAFVTPFGLFHFRRMPFGLRGAPATFQRMVDRLLDGLNDFSSAYIDDIIIFSGTWEDHLQHLRQVLRRIQEAGLTLRRKKCQFGMSDCVYLGHLIGSGRVRPEELKVSAVREFSQPRTKKDVRSFLGLTGYYRRFIPRYATLALPLTDMTKKDEPNKVAWSVECGVAFQALKAALCSQPVLMSPNFQKEFVLQTDALDRGVGAVLSQMDDEGNDRPIAYYSHKLLPRQAKYSTVEKECLAIKLAVQTFHPYLMGQKFRIQTDHRSLEWLNNVKD